MSINVPTIHEELQFYREENYELQLEIDKLVSERDEAMEAVEKWKNMALYWETRYTELDSMCEHKV